MNTLPAFALVLSTLALAVSAHAADPKKMAGNKRLMDQSNATLISSEAALQVMDENIPEKAWKIVKGSQYVWLSQVEGGMSGTTCVVTARVMVLPLTATLNVPMFRPKSTATTFDAAPNSSIDACKALAKVKLKEATVAVASSVVKLN
jgi:hypothetical protein